MAKLSGHGTVIHSRGGHIIQSQDFNNLVTAAGKEAAVRAFFLGELPGTDWYTGVIGTRNPDSRVVADVSDTMISHPGWTESESTGPLRLAYNSERIKFKVITTAPDLICGLFLTTNKIVGSTEGLLWSVIILPQLLKPINGDDILIRYILNFEAVETKWTPTT